MGDPPRKLPLRRILVGAFVLPWRNRWSVMRAVGVPMLALLAVFLAWHTLSLNSSEVTWFLWGAFVISIAWLAIATHRLVLTHGWKPHGALAEFSFRRFAWFVGALLFIWLAVLVITMIVATIAANIVIGPRYVAAGETPPPDPPREYFEWLQSFGTVVAYFVVGRFSLVLPAIAVDRKPNLLEAWRCSRRNSWRLAFIVGALPWILERVTYVLWRDVPMTLEIACFGILFGAFAIIGFVACRCPTTSSRTCPRHRPQIHPADAGLQQQPARFRESAARRHHVVHDRDVLGG
jgi:hypothetical protein